MKRIWSAVFMGNTQISVFLCMYDVQYSTGIKTDSKVLFFCPV